MERQESFLGCTPMKTEKTVDKRVSDAKKLAFLVWAPHSERARGICEGSGAELYLMSYKFRSKIYAPIKYPFLFLKSLSLLRNQRRETVICQAPPIFCPMAAMTYRLFGNRRTRVVIDLHSGALEKPWTYLNPLNRAIMKSASTVLVSNKEARDHVLREYGVRSVVLEDRIPRLDIVPPDKRERDQDTELEIVVPSSFAYDEPIEEILDAAAALPKTRFYLTGDSSRLDSNILKNKPDNIVFTGFLKDDDYARLLNSADAVMVLTKRDRTMLAGAYEAVALEKPLVTSDWPPLKRYFHMGTVHVDNSTQEIIDAVQTVRQKNDELKEEMGLLRKEKTREWESVFTEFKDAIAG
jgi:glycosyltransferase involved in cell wall biosynthesis